MFVVLHIFLNCRYNGFQAPQMLLNKGYEIEVSPRQTQIHVTTKISYLYHYKHYRAEAANYIHTSIGEALT